MNTDDGQASGGAIVDWDAARSLTGGDDALLDELIELFPGESSKHLAAIRAAVASEDAEALARAAHTLKSSARLFGAELLAAQALAVENLGRSASAAEAARHLPDLERAIELVVTALKQRPVA